MKPTTRIVVAAGAALAVAVGGGAAAFAGQSSDAHANGGPQKVQQQKLVSSPSGGSGSTFVPVAPCRVVNTAKRHHRLGVGTRIFRVSGTSHFVGQGGQPGGCGIPASADAVTVSLTASAAKGTGRLVAFPAGGGPNGTTTLSYSKGRSTTSGATVGLGAGTGKRLAIRAYQKATHLAVDVTGYYAPPLTAFVDTAGTLQYGSGRALSTTHTSTGNYTVTFDRDVSGCSFQVTPYAFNWAVAVGPEFGHADTAHVYIHEQGASTTPHDTSFFITADC